MINQPRHPSRRISLRQTTSRRLYFETLEERSVLSTVTATLTADNFYRMYHGSADGSQLTFVGQDRDGPSRSSWQSLDNWTFDTGSSDYIYVAATNSDQIKMFLGSFLIDGSLIVTNGSDWECFEGTISQIGGATWFSPQASAPQRFPAVMAWDNERFWTKGVDASANYIWSRGFEFNQGANQVVFRTPVQSTSDIRMLSAELEGANTVEFSYVTGGNPGQFEVGLYRSTDGVTYNPADLIDTQTVTPAAGGGQGTGAFTVGALTSDTDLPYLLVVADPSNVIQESDEDNNSQSIKLPDIVLLDVTTEDFKWFQVDYQVLHSDVPDFRFGAYLSSNESFDPPSESGTGDTPLGEFDASFLTADANVIYRDYLAVSADVSETARFVIIVADSEGSVLETSRRNNTQFAIPLLGPGVRMNRIGMIGTSGFGETQDTASGAFTGAILRDTADFDKLKSLDFSWPFDFKDEEPIGFRDEDHLGQESVLKPMSAFGELIIKDGDRAPSLWRDYGFRINDAYDSLGEHLPTSLHYEGRALDFGLTLESNPVPDLNGLARLAGLAWLAGFDWVEHEKEEGTTRPHVHVSEHRSFVASISEQTLRDAVLGAFDSGKIVNEGIVQALSSALTGFDRGVASGDYSAASGKLTAFQKLVKAQSGKAIDERLAVLLLTNAAILQKQVDQLVEDDKKLAESSNDRSEIFDTGSVDIAIGDLFQ